MSSYVYGPPNPKTLIPPIIPPPIADFQSWRNSSLTPNNYINSTTPVTYISSSGYVASTHEPTIVLNTEKSMPNGNASNSHVPLPANINPYYVQALSGPNSWTVTKPSGVNSNIGISEMSQNGFFMPFGASGTDYQIYIESQSPQIPENSSTSLKLGNNIRQVLMNDPDPRAYSYGPTNRVFIDGKTGIPSYFYKDIDQARQIGFIQRNNTNIHVIECSSNDAKVFAQDQYIRDTNFQRTNLQTSLMRKTNSELWQRKVAPISALKFPRN